ncbi:hypothetical protein GCM10023317_32200 [Actinopolymorpha pittospori]
MWPCVATPIACGSKQRADPPRHLSHQPLRRGGEDFLYVFKGGPNRAAAPARWRRLSLRAFGARSAGAAGREKKAARRLTTLTASAPILEDLAVAGAGRRLYPPRLVRVPKTGGPRRTVGGRQQAGRRAGTGYGPPASRTKPGHRPNPPPLRARPPKLCHPSRSIP